MMASGGSGRGARSGRGGRRRPRGSRAPAQGGPKKGRAAVAPNPRKGKAFSTPYEVPETGAVEPFDLFCACFLGLMPDGTYRNSGLGEVAKRFRRSPGELKQMLRTYGMDTESLRDVDFDVTLAKLDIQVAPEGIDRRELARGLFDEFVDVHPTLQDAVNGNGTSAPAGDASPKPAPAAVPEARERNAKPAAAPPEPEPAEEAEASEAVDEAVDEPADVPADEVADEPDEAVADEGEDALVTADVGRAGEAETPPAGKRRADRPVRQIRRSPVRRGGRT